LIPALLHAKIPMMNNRDAYRLREKHQHFGRVGDRPHTSSPVRRHKDKTDVIELISQRALPRDLQVALAVRPLYFETWDAFHKEL